MQKKNPQNLICVHAESAEKYLNFFEHIDRKVSIVSVFTKGIKFKMMELI